jgi:WD40 repeat protein
MRTLRVNRRALLLGVLMLLTVAPVTRASNITAYVTGGVTIWAWNINSNTMTSVVNSADGGLVDSLIFDTHGDIIYSVIGTNNLGLYNLSTHANSIIASAGPGVADMALDPGGASFLVSNAADGSIDRVNLTTHAVTTLYNGGQRPDGLAYDNSGHLFAVLSLNEVAQLDPVTGAVLKTISTPNEPDGMTFDATTGKLYVSSDGGGFYTLPTDLSSATFTSVAGSPVFDGIASQNNLLYFVVRGTGVLQYGLSTSSVSLISPGIPGADDIGPLAGLGSQTPEPGTLVMFVSGIFGLAGVLRRKIAF